MGVFDLFSKRQCRARGEMPEVYKYNELPHPLRVQIVQIVECAIGKDQYGYHNSEEAYNFLNNTLSGTCQ